MKDSMEYMNFQITLIDEALLILNKLLESTMVDDLHGRGFGSFYPEKSINYLMTMRYAIELELESYKRKIR